MRKRMGVCLLLCAAASSGWAGGSLGAVLSVQLTVQPRCARSADLGRSPERVTEGAALQCTPGVAKAVAVGQERAPQAAGATTSQPVPWDSQPGAKKVVAVVF